MQQSSKNTKVIVMGDSAGGWLAIQMASQRSHQIYSTILLYPLVEYDTLKFESANKFGVAYWYLLDREFILWIQRNTHSDAHEVRGMELNYTKFPKTLLLLTREDVLYDEGKLLEQRLIQYDVNVNVKEYDAHHGAFSYPIALFFRKAHNQMYEDILNWVLQE